MLETINGIDLVLALLAAAGWTAWRIERASSPVYRRHRRTEVYDWQRQGL